MADVVIHLLAHGRPLCGFTDELPRDWPKGHKWESYFDWVADKAMPVRGNHCTDCLAEAEERLFDA